MKTVLFLFMFVGLMGGGYWYAKHAAEDAAKHAAYEARHNAIRDGDDDSPIIITDGSSIHFAQRDGWTVVGDLNLYAQVRDHKPHRLRIGYCPTPSNKPTDESKCSTISEYKPKNSMDLHVCEGADCNKNTAAAGVHWVKADEIVVAVNGATRFDTGNQTGDGDDEFLRDVRLKYASVEIDGLPAANVDCSKPGSGMVCAVRICYAPKVEKCKN